MQHQPGASGAGAWASAFEPGPVANALRVCRGPDHFPFQGFRDSGIGSQGITNSLAMMVKVGGCSAGGVVTG